MNAVASTERQEFRNEPVIRVGNDCIRGFLKGATMQGYSPEAILYRAGLPLSCYEDPASTIDGKQLLKLLLALEIETGDIFMGFLDQPAKPGMQMVHTKLWVQSETLGEAIRSSTQLREQLRNDVHYDYVHNRKHHTFALGINGYQLKEGVDSFLFYWHRLMQIYRSYSWLVGKRIKLHSVGFTMPEPQGYNNIQSVFRCKVKFNQPTNYLCFDRNYLNATIIRTESELQHFDMFRQYPDWFSIPGQDLSWSRRVEDACLQLHMEGRGHDISLDTVAEIVNIGMRTLRRQLLAESECFKDIRDRVRLNLAIRLLVVTDTPITRIAGRLGYQDPGSFSRAFNNWTRCTPSTYRKQHTGDRELLAEAATSPVLERYLSRGQRQIAL